MKKYTRIVLVKCLALSTLFLASAISLNGQTTVIANYDFEKNSKKWERRGQNVSIKASDTVAATGKKSLHVQGRKENWQGAQINLTKTLIKGRMYKFSVAVKLDKNDKNEILKMTMERGNGRYDTLSATFANSSTWVTMNGQFRPDGKDPYMLVYLESDNPRVSFYIDDFKIEEVMPKKQEGVLIKNDFQDKTLQGWQITAANVAVFSISELANNYLRATGRTEAWHGLSRDLSTDIYKQVEYTFSVRAKLVKGEKKAKIKLTMRQTNDKGKEKYVPIASETVTEGAWVTISGTYSVKKDQTGYLFIIESDSPTAAYYVDDFEMRVNK